MTNMPYWSFLDQSVLLFPPEWIRSALVLALITVWMVIGLFTYMNYSNTATLISACGRSRGCFIRCTWRRRLDWKNPRIRHFC